MLFAVTLFQHWYGQMVWFKGENQTQGNMFFFIYLLDGCLFGQRQCGVRGKGGENIGAYCCNLGESRECYQ
jgi:hypothetical protein